MEIEVMRKVNHPNCITLETVYESANHIYIVMELVRVRPISAGRKAPFADAACPQRFAVAVMWSISPAPHTLCWRHDRAREA
jgi:hypothetical protein